MITPEQIAEYVPYGPTEPVQAYLDEQLLSRQRCPISPSLFT
ncbi:hypothetical protein [Streptomyces sp. NRRL S-495]